MGNSVFRGRLKRWNEDKGLGFINTENKGQDIFIHISAFKGMSRRPIVEDIIFYEIHTDNDGRNRAVNAKIKGVAVKPKIHEKNTRTNNKKKWFPKWFFIILLISLVFALYEKFSKEAKIPPNEIYSITTFQKEEVYESAYYEEVKEEVYGNAYYEEVNKESYSCIGKRYCTEMTSCEEATYYQRNCPETEMDGDNDGIPCERQWCN